MIALARAFQRGLRLPERARGFGRPTGVPIQGVPLGQQFSGSRTARLLWAHCLRCGSEKGGFTVDNHSYTPLLDTHSCVIEL